MNVYALTFSPTGGTKRVAAALARALHPQPVEVDLTQEGFDAPELAAEDLCVLAVPSFGGRCPAISVSRIERMRGNGALAVLVAVYGNRAFEDTLVELRDALAAAGFRCVAAVAAVAEHSILRQFAAGRPDARDDKELAAFAERILGKLASQEGTEEPELPGDRPYRVYGGVPMKPKAGKNCVSCGLCAQKCPVGAIPAADPRKTDGEKCISCMRCVAVCPQHARAINKLMLAAAGKKLEKACAGRKENALYL